eukprot:gnl/TRDRNA2_/TRDRNA2_136497_c0_seq2.p1 gnl/TRDRNA2_/TRDRNA2_136497_c0~~gnl/TRDRNA2_/TRDRNA2_136497_c0_seq2.p1  ORF type:complete len:301 (-),score=57.69 gnl/TRDRNA2_/TRDRNA2_136497_c0_seq2:34-936(-)
MVKCSKLGVGFVLLAWAHGKELGTSTEDDAQLLRRSHQRLEHLHAALDHTVIGKASHLAAAPITGATSLRFPVGRANGAHHPVMRDVASVWSCGARCDKLAAAAARPEAHLSSRREAGLTAMLGALLAGAMPRLALADESFSDGPEGLKYRDLTVGDGAIATDGDIIKANYIVKLVTTGETVSEGKGFLYCAGGGKQIKGWEMAVTGSDGFSAMQAGGKRQAIIPPQLAYGAEGVGGCKEAECIATNDAGECIKRKEQAKCAVPPDSALDFTIEILSIRGRCRNVLDTPREFRKGDLRLL